MEQLLSNNYDNTLNEHFPGRIKRALIIISKSHEGCNFSKMEKYYGYKNSENVKRRIILEPDQEKKYKFMLTIKFNKRDYDLLYNNIKELPRDVNNHIYSYLHTKKEIKWSIEFPHQYPFENTIWKLLEYKSTKSFHSHQIEEEQKVKQFQCGSLTIIQFLEKEILLYLMTLSWFN